MTKLPFNSLIGVFMVKDIEAAMTWYRAWLGEPDVIPMEGMAEYKITDTAWLQLNVDDGDRTSGTIIIGVEDAAKYRQQLLDKGIEVGELMDYEVVLTFDVTDPDGNRISFAQER